MVTRQPFPRQRPTCCIHQTGGPAAVDHRPGSVHPPLGRDGADLGHQPHDGGDSRALYIVGQPLCTDDVMERLNISRGQREHEPAGPVRLGHHPPTAQARRAAGIFRKPCRRLGDVFAHRRRAKTPRDGPGAGDDQAVPADAGRIEASARPPPSSEAVSRRRQRLAGMEEFMEVTNKIFQQFIGNAQSGLTQVVKVLLKAF